MKFKNFQLIINNNLATKEDILNIYAKGLQYIKEYGNDLYEIHKEIIDNQFLWLYCEYDNSELYNESVLNKEKEEKETNPRTKAQVELRQQLFVCYDMKTKMLYMNNIDKKGFVKYYIADSLQKEVSIKNIYASLEDFQKRVKGIKSLKFVQKHNLENMNDESIFQQCTNLYGLDCPSKLTMQVEYENLPISVLSNVLQSFQQRIHTIEFESIVLIGYDDEKVENIFDFKSIVKDIEILPNKDNNNRFNNEEIKNKFLNKIKEL